MKKAKKKGNQKTIFSLIVVIVLLAVFLGLKINENSVKITGRVVTLEEGYYVRMLNPIKDPVKGTTDIQVDILFPDNVLAIQKSFSCTEESHADFDGLNSKINIPSSESLNFLKDGGYTWSAWINVNDINKMGGIIQKGTNLSGFEIVQLNDIITFAYYNGMGASINWIPKEFAISERTWNLITITYNNGNSKVYINGALASDMTAPEHMVPTDDTSSNFLIGTGLFPDTSQSERRLSRNFIELPQSFDGKIDEVMFFNKALSQSKIDEIYNLGRYIKSYSNNNLVSWWKFSNNITAIDSLGINNGTFQNNAHVSFETEDGILSYNLEPEIDIFEFNPNENTWILANKSDTIKTSLHYSIPYNCDVVGGTFSIIKDNETLDTGEIEGIASEENCQIEGDENNNNMSDCQDPACPSKTYCDIENTKLCQDNECLMPWCDGADINNDTKVDTTDLTILATNFGSTNCSSINEWCNWADINYYINDTNVDTTDLTILATYFGETDCFGPPKLLENCQIAGDEDKNGLADCQDLGCPESTLCDTGNVNICQSGECRAPPLNVSSPISLGTDITAWCNGTDMNQDGKVDTTDLTILGTYYGYTNETCKGDKLCLNADANKDGLRDTTDLSILGTYYGYTCFGPI